MSRASGRLARHGPFGHLYLHTIMMVLASVAATSFSIQLLFSLLSCSASAPPHSPQRPWEHVPPPRIRPTPAPKPTRVVAIVRPRGRFTACAHHRYRHRRTSHSSSRPLLCSSSPTCCLYPLSQPQADRCSSTRVRGESVLLLAFLRACRRGGHGSACHT
jgi:hypothetical protein